MVLMQVVKNNCFIFPGKVPDTPGRTDPWRRLSRSRRLVFIGILLPPRDVHHTNDRSVTVHLQTVSGGGKGKERQ